MNIISFCRLSKRHGQQIIFSDLSLVLPNKGLVAVIGESGSGKTTLLDIIAGLDVDYEGAVEILGKSPKSLSERERSSFRLREIGYIRQSYDLLELETILDNVLLPLNATSEETDVIKKRKAMSLLASLGLENKAKQRTNTLSGGEKQRVAIARALINDPSIVLADEPTGALDAANAEKIYELLAKIGEKRLVLLVSHDLKRTQKYANVLLRLENGKLLNEKSDSVKSEIEGRAYPICRGEKQTPHVGFLTWLKHSFHLMKAKKWRTLLGRTVITFSFLAFALALYVSRDLSSELENAFSSLTGSGLVVMEPNNKGEETFGSVLPVNENETKKILDNHKDFIFDYGVSYVGRFESFFPDIHAVYIPLKSQKFLLQDASIRTALDFSWLDQEEVTVLPNKPTVMEDDEVVLGLPYESMAGLCLGLGILRNYNTLSVYLSSHPLNLVFELENDSWSYLDEQIFRIDGIVETERPRLYHLNHRWNTYLLETKMCFPIAAVGKPWYVEKLFYFSKRKGIDNFHQKTRDCADLSDFVFEGLQKEWAPSLYEEDKAVGPNRYYPYFADKHSLPNEAIKTVASLSYWSDYVYGASGSYMAYPESLMVGFASPFYVSPEEKSLLTVIDLRSDQSQEESLLDVGLPGDTLMGSYLKPASSSLTLSADFSSLLSGNKPETLNEVVLSKKLDERLGHPSVLYVAGEARMELDGARVHRTYGLEKLEVTGVCEGNNYVLHALSNWPLDFFSEKLGMSAFYLEPTRVIFHVKKGLDSAVVAKELGKQFPSFSFVDPSTRIKDSIEEIISYVNIALYGGMGVCLLLGVLLLGVVTFLNVVENQSEGRFLYELGLSRGGIGDCFGATLFAHLGVSTIISLFFISVLEYVVDKTIKQSFSYASPFVFDVMPLLGILMLSGMMLVVLQVLLNSWINRRDFRREGR